MGDVIVTAQRVGQRVDGGNWCIGERLACQASPKQHIAARFDVGAVADGMGEIGRHQRQCLTGEHVGIGVFLQF